jgi:ELWxxDGT repeat protein
MVKDINPLGSTVFDEFVDLNGILIFTINDGDELWRSNGTGAGTYKVVETCDAGPSGISYLTVHKNYVYFSAFNLTFRTFEA